MEVLFLDNISAILQELLKKSKRPVNVALVIFKTMNVAMADAGFE